MAYLNLVRINHDNLIEVIFRGDQTQETVAAVVQAGKMLADRLRRQGSPVLVLANLEDLGNSDANARRAVAKSLKELTYDRVAAYGAPKFVEKVASLVVRAIGREDKVKVFKSRQDAVSWLFGLPATAASPEKVGGKEKSNQYRQYVKMKLEELNDIISLATIGEYSSNIEIPSEDDEFTDTFVGIKLLVKTLEEKAKQIQSLTPSGEQASDVTGRKRVFFERKLQSPFE